MRKGLGQKRVINFFDHTIKTLEKTVTSLQPVVSLFCILLHHHGLEQNHDV